MNDIYTYNINIAWLEGRKGIVESNILNDKIEVATPPEFAKGISGIWSPEHLFIAATGSCFMTTFLAIAEKSRLEFISFRCSASGILEKKDNAMMISSITLHPILKVATQDSISKGLKILYLSHHSCLISNSIKSEVILMPHVHCDSQLPSTS